MTYCVCVASHRRSIAKSHKMALCVPVYLRGARESIGNEKLLASIIASVAPRTCEVAFVVN